VFALSKCSAKPFGVLAPPCMRYSLHNFDNLRAALLQSWPKAPHQFRQIAMVEYGECTGDVARGVRGRCRLTVVVVRVTAGSRIWNCPLGCEGMELLARSLAQAKNLATLSYVVSQRGAPACAIALSRLPSRRVVLVHRLNAVGMKARGAQALAKYLPSWQFLVMLRYGRTDVVVAVEWVCSKKRPPE